jgi:hypothetical protein
MAGFEKPLFLLVLGDFAFAVAEAPRNRFFLVLGDLAVELSGGN